MILFRKMWDASNPTMPWPKWLLAVAGYIGGDTPHVWSVAQWRSAGKRRKLPIWVASLTGPRNGTVDGFDILMRLFILGVPKGAAVLLDMETTVDPAYVLAVYAVIKWGGYKLWVYGSNGPVQKNPPCDGYIVATLNGIEAMVSGANVRATQYANHGWFDTSIVKIFYFLRDIKTWLP